MTILQFANNATTTLAQPITAVSTTIYVAAGTGALFPQPTTGFNFLATIYNSSSTLDEVVLVTARSGDQLTVTRAQEGTIAQTWIIGDTIGMYPTKGTMEKLVQNDQLQNGKYTIAQAAGTANALTCQITSDLTSIPDGMTLVLKPVYTNTSACTLQVTMGSTLLSAVPIVKGPNLALEPTDIPSAGYPVQLIYSVIYNAWVMQMPSTLISPPITNYSIEYLVVAGGGGGGTGAISGFSQAGGGGGAGGFVNNSITVIPTSVFNITVGAGGPTGTTGNNTSISGVVTVFGGGGGANGPVSGNNNGAAGGSGGGGSGGSALGGNGITGQGHNGGNSIAEQAGGGGGAGTVGTVGNGGAGSISAISGTSVYYAGGGGGGSQSVVGLGGTGGGGNSGISTGVGSNGGANLGGGAGGGGPFDAAGGSGGSGVVYLSMLTTKYTGVTTGAPLVTTSGLYTVLKYTNSGSYTA